MKRNIRVEIYNLDHGFLGGGYLFKESVEKPDSFFDASLNQVHENGFRETGVTLWEDNMLHGFGNTVITNSTLKIKVVEVP